MSSFITALDNMQKQQLGENGHLEYKTKQMDIPQFFFQLVRCEDHSHLENMLRNILYTIKDDEKNYEWELKTLYKLIAQTRDIVDGKGEYNLSFMMIYNWYMFYPEETKKILEFFTCNVLGEHPYGSWKDMKYLCEYVKLRGGEYHPLIDYCVELLIEQLQRDIDLVERYKIVDEITLDQVCKGLSLVAKWIPREKSKFKWLHRRIAYRLHPEFIETASASVIVEHRNEKVLKAKIKCKIVLNRHIVEINKLLDTVQIKQCAKNYSNIDFKKVTSITHNKQRYAFLNLNKDTTVRSNDPDRVQAAVNYENYINDVKSGKVKNINAKRCNVYELVKSAVESGSDNPVVKDSINQQWLSNSTNTKALTYMIPMADTSGSMSVDNCIPLYNSIGLSIRVSEKCHPVFQNRILTFDSNPEWIVLDHNDTFVDKVQKVRHASWGMNTNFYAALDKILDGILQSDLSPEEVSNMVLAVFSDMQIDASLQEGETINGLYENIKKRYEDAGLNSRYHTPFEPPHILFWNLRSTTGFPCVSGQKNVTYLSGYSSTLLNLFSEKGLDGIKEYTPKKALDEILTNKRYEFLERYLTKYFVNRHIKWD